MKKVTLPLVFLIVTSLGVFPCRATISEFPSGESIDEKELLSAICSGWVEVASAEESKSVALWDVSLEIGPNSRLLLGANSSYFYALTLEGEFAVGKKVAPAGKIMVWSHYGDNGGKAKVFFYSAERLSTVFGAKGFPDDPDLEIIARTQKKKQFWGFLRQTGFNVAAPVGNEREETRALYQANPTVIGVKRASADREDYPTNTVAAFVDALIAKDVDSVATLLSPDLFLEGASAAQIEQLLANERKAFATHLLHSGSYDRFQNSTIESLGNATYAAKAGDHQLSITLEAFDGAVYVTSMTPQ